MIDVTELPNYKKQVNYIIDGEVVGFVLLEETLDFINIIDVLVNFEFRKKGIATKLFNYVFSMYSEKDVKFMLEVRESNMPAYNLYKKLGFEVIYKREKYYKDEDALIMEVKK